MAADRRLRILSRLAADGDAALWPVRLCDVCAEVTVMSGAGIMMMSGGLPLGSVGTTDEMSVLIEELQYTLGEGPCVDAYELQRPVLEPDLAAPSTARWLAFTRTAVEAGVRAVFGFPIEVGAVRLGALNLYRDRPGFLSDDQHADALVLAAVAARAMLAVQANAAPGALAEELESGLNFRFVVHQASGMVSAQLQVSLGDALVRLRAYAFANERVLAEVAEEVVSRRLWFDDRLPNA